LDHREKLQAVAAELQKLLADEFVLYTRPATYIECTGQQLYGAAQTVRGQYEQLDTSWTPCRTHRQLGHFAEGQLKDFVQLTRLGEDGYTSDHKIQLKNLLEDHETIARIIRKDINEFTDDYKDAGSADL